MAVHSNGIAPGTVAPGFNLEISNPWVDDRAGPSRSLDAYTDAPALVVLFTCNHCPYAIHVQSALVKLASDYMAKGVAFVAINANDPQRYPADRLEEMTKRAKDIEMPFPYLFDASQEIAKAYQAACTPEFFVFDGNQALVYSGRFDETRPGQGQAHGGDLKSALDAVLSGSPPVEHQLPSIGCSIKWKPGNEPDYS